jgi:hypothetical protein
MPRSEQPNFDISHSLDPERKKTLFGFSPRKIRWFRATSSPEEADAVIVPLGGREPVLSNKMTKESQEEMIAILRSAADKNKSKAK